MRKFNLGTIKVEMNNNGFPKGLILKRDLTLRECKYLMRELLGIDILTRDCYEFADDYADYNDELVKDVNDWLRGNLDDEGIAQYAYDCSDEQLGIMNLIPILNYLIKKEIV